MAATTTPTQAKDQVDRALLLDVVVAQRASVLQLLASEDQALLVGWDALLVRDLRLDVLDGVAGLDLERDRLARQRLHENCIIDRSIDRQTKQKLVVPSSLSPSQKNKPQHDSLCIVTATTTTTTMGRTIQYKYGVKSRCS